MTVPLQIDEDLETMLTFYHDLGRIIYFGSLSKDKSALNDIVILDPQWLVDVFKQVIRLPGLEEMVTHVFVFRPCKDGGREGRDPFRLLS